MTQNESESVERFFLEYLEVCQAWNGLTDQHMTIGQGLKRLAPITSQNLSPSLARQARRLTREIILGRSYVEREVV